MLNLAAELSWFVVFESNSRFWVVFILYRCWLIALKEIRGHSISISQRHWGQLTLNLFNPGHSLRHRDLEILAISNSHLLESFAWDVVSHDLFIVILLLCFNLVRISKQVLLANVMNSRFLFFLRYLVRLILRWLSFLLNKFNRSIETLKFYCFSRDWPRLFINWNTFMCCICH